MPAVTVVTPGLGPDSDDPGATTGKRLLVAFDNPCQKPIIVFANIRGGRTITSTKRLMHFYYQFPAQQGFPSGLTGDHRSASARFNIVGAHCLNHGGSLYLADGDPSDEYTIDIRWRVLEAPHYHWHNLTAYLAAPGDYRLPPFHSEMQLRPGQDFALGPLASDANDGWMPLPMGQELLTLRDSGSVIHTRWFG